MITILSAFVSLLSFRLRGRASLEFEVVALRHQVAVLRRQRSGRLRLFCADRLLWVWLWESVIAILLDGNTEASFSAELVPAVGTEIRMGFVPISICWHTMNSNLIPSVALKAARSKGAGNFVWIVAQCCSPRQLNL